MEVCNNRTNKHTFEKIPWQERKEINLPKQNKAGEVVG